MIRQDRQTEEESRTRMEGPKRAEGWTWTKKKATRGGLKTHNTTVLMTLSSAPFPFLSTICRSNPAGL